MSATKRDQVLAQLKLMIESTDPAMAPVAGDEDSGARHERYQALHKQVVGALEDDPSVDAAAKEIGLSFI